MHFRDDIFRLDSRHINVWCCWSLRPTVAGHSPNMSEVRASVSSRERASRLANPFCPDSISIIAAGSIEKRTKAVRIWRSSQRPEMRFVQSVFVSDICIVSFLSTRNFWSNFRGSSIINCDISAISGILEVYPISATFNFNEISRRTLYDVSLALRLITLIR